MIEYARRASRLQLLGFTASLGIKTALLVETARNGAMSRVKGICCGHESVAISDARGPRVAVRIINALSAGYALLRCGQTVCASPPEASSYVRGFHLCVPCRHGVGSSERPTVA